jgi:hypothetical protein
VVVLFPVAAGRLEKKEFPLEEDYGVQLHVVDYNLECSFFCYPDSASSTHLHGIDGHQDAYIWPSTALEGA